MHHVAAFYRFADLPDPEALCAPLQAFGADHGLAGTVLVAAEGVNGTVAGSRAGLGALLGHLRAWPDCAALEAKWSTAAEMPFSRFKVRLKREIVTMGRADIRPANGTGIYVPPAAWNALISDPDTVTIDTRNAYETRIGSFEGALDPEIESFGDFPAWWAAHRDRFAGKRIAMFCTGGIRCEKSTALLRAEGREVYHLEGGILKYLEEVPEPDSLWHGECFVFDQRVALGHGLAEGDAQLCHACRRPVTQADMESPDWEQGVSCPLCISEFSDADRERFRERQRQIALAAARGARHLA
ncbi:MAG: rhodanese-related sulfurtransferase [Pseudomonadota bacterium]